MTAVSREAMGWSERCASEARALPKETRQKFLDLMHSGMTLGESGRECGISFEASCGIMNENIEQRLYRTLRAEAK